MQTPAVLTVTSPLVQAMRVTLNRILEEKQVESLLQQMRKLLYALRSRRKRCEEKEGGKNNSTRKG